MAAACRAAGLAFLEGARSGWNKTDLDAWHDRVYSLVTVRLQGEADDLSPESGLRPRNVADLIELVGVAVTVALRESAREPGALVDAALRAGAVITIRHEDGELWMPADRSDVDLETRVLSLFATDYLLNPDAYETELSVCGECDGVSFDAFGQCPTCTSAHSGMRRVHHFGGSGATKVG